MQRNCLDQVRTQFIPAISFSEYAVAQCASVEATFLASRISKISSMSPEYPNGSGGRKEDLCATVARGGW